MLSEDGWDTTPAIVSVWADDRGRATVWRRPSGAGRLVREDTTFTPWALVDSLDAVTRLAPHVRVRELDGPGALRFLVEADDGRVLRSLRDAGKAHALVLPPDEQYLVQSGRTYFRDLTFDHLRRFQFDLETTGLNPASDRIFLIATRDPDGVVEMLEARSLDDGGEADLIRSLVRKVTVCDPDVIENHNLHGFDIPFLVRRARRLGVTLSLGRLPGSLRTRAARRGVSSDEADGPQRIRYVAPGRELIDTMDAVMHYGFSTGSLPHRGLKAVARHFGIAGPDRELIPGDQIHAVYLRDPERVRRYAAADVEEVAGLARILGGAAFALATLAPRRYERLSDAGAATGIIDPMLVRAYLRAGQALPAHQAGREIEHSGAALHLFATGVARSIVKADVASLYPSLMRAYRIGPSRDHLGALLSLVDTLVERRLVAKAAAKAAPAGSAERHGHEAMSAAMKLVVNSAYGYLDRWRTDPLR